MSQQLESPCTTGETGTAENASASTSAQSLPVAAPTSEQDQTLAQMLCAARWVSRALVCLLLLVVPASLVVVWNEEKDHRTCPADWALWLVGSDKNVNEAIVEAIDKGKEDSPFKNDELKSLVKPFDWDSDKVINLNDLILGKPLEE